MNEQAPSNQPSDESSAEVEADTVEQQRPGDLPRIYVASLSDYNDGVLHGSWIDANVEPEDFHAGISEMLQASPTAKRSGQPAEEWAFHDYENYGPLRIDEHDSVEWVTAVARGIDQHGPAFAAWAAQTGHDIEALDRFEDCYLGQWDSLEDYAQSFLDDIGVEEQLDKIDPWIRAYVSVDTAAFARDLDYGGDVTAIERPDGGVWLFDGGR